MDKVRKQGTVFDIDWTLPSTKKETKTKKKMYQDQ